MLRRLAVSAASAALLLAAAPVGAQNSPAPQTPPVATDQPIRFKSAVDWCR